MSLLLKIDGLVEGTVAKRPSKFIKTPYVADIQILESKRDVLGHTASLGCCGLADVGATIMMAVTRAAIRMRFLAPVTLSAHMMATMMAISKKRGCIKVASANQPPTYATASQNFLSSVGLRLARMRPAIIMKHDAIGAS